MLLTEVALFTLIAVLAHDDLGETDDPQFAEVIERDVLGPYAGILREIEGLKAHPQAEPEFLEQLRRFADLRVESWRLLVDALREQDDEKLQEHERTWPRLMQPQTGCWGRPAAGNPRDHEEAEGAPGESPDRLGPLPSCGRVD